MFDPNNIKRFVACCTFTSQEAAAINQRAEDAAKGEGAFTSSRLEEILGTKELADAFLKMWNERPGVLLEGRAA
jgi:hypothetical protein